MFLSTFLGMRRYSHKLTKSSEGMQSEYLDQMGKISAPQMKNHRATTQSKFSPGSSNSVKFQFSQLLTFHWHPLVMVSTSQHLLFKKTESQGNQLKNSKEEIPLVTLIYITYHSVEGFCESRPGGLTKLTRTTSLVRAFKPFEIPSTDYIQPHSSHYLPRTTYNDAGVLVMRKP